ncbi:MAG TPA: hypothetical protein VKV27_08720 [Solirubrobacteraceae bacterium]|nr:hypothetical protein [Solirubrobacteraceae bacterium]
MSPEEILVFESRARVRRAAVAIGAAILIMAAALVQLSGPHATVNEETLSLLTFNRRAPRDLIAAVISGVGTLAVAWTLLELLRSARARSPERVRPWIRPLVIVGALLDSVIAVVYAAILTEKAHQFATTGAQTYDEAVRLTGGSALLVLQLAGFLGAFLIAIAFVLVSLQAMNQGLLTRFLGYLGMFAGALVLFQITQVPVVQAVWLLAVGYLMSGRWPSGLPAAWSTGRAAPWPSSAELRAQRAAAAGARQPAGGRRRSRPAPAAAAPVDGGTAGSTGSVSASRRKRKRRG